MTRLSAVILLFLPIHALGFVEPTWKSCRPPQQQLFRLTLARRSSARGFQGPLDVATTGDAIAYGEWSGDDSIQVDSYGYVLERIPSSEESQDLVEDDADFSLSEFKTDGMEPPPTTTASAMAMVPLTNPVVVSSPSTPSSVVATTFNVMKAMLGSGILALSSGVAAVSDYKTTVWSANALFFVLGLLSAYTFCLYGRLCHATNAKSLGDIWKRVYDTEDSTPISLASFTFCYGGGLIFLLIIGDTLSSLAKALLSSSTNPLASAGWLVSRQTAILTAMTSCLVPLCSLKSMAALSPISIIGVLASIISSAFVVWRCPLVFPGSPYCAATAGNFLSSLAAHQLPQFGSYYKVFSTAPMVLMGMAGMALMAHFSAPDFYQALSGGLKEVKNEDDQTEATVKSNVPLKNYMKATALSFVTVGLVNAITMTCGFLTFGGNSGGMILNNYAINDIGAAISRLLVAVSMIGSFPLLFMALRASVDDLLVGRRKDDAKSVIDYQAPLELSARNWKLKFGLLSSLTFLSMIVKDVGLVVGLNGAITGSVIIYSFPALMFLRLVRRGSSGTESLPSGIVVLKGERTLCRGLVGFGLVSAILGGATTILNACFGNS
ncbi:hypothetical protein ACA910_004184 [Epithemia clementina (nom. ined.)]